MINIRRALQSSRESWFKKAMRLFDRDAIDEGVWDELEELLVSADVGAATAEKLIARVRQRIKAEGLAPGAPVRDVLKAEMVAMLQVDSPAAPLPPPVVVTLVVGVNGGGKTTSVAKLAYRVKSEGRAAILAAADTFRAAAIDQLRHLGEQIGVDVIAHQPGADAGAVVFDALQAARSRQADELIIDTAGRLHTKYNLMEELKKLKRVAAKVDATAPHQVLLVLDATTGQNGLAQARHFAQAVAVTGVFLTKLDGTAKGGIVLAIADELKIPIRYLGVGDELADITDFDAEGFVEALCA